mmetsp:Transcript_3715/g.11082  ORF Transcript_3715/g.11082 Transcript_3715/m.11082 type:complete len:296 (+) Transcript_3715:300-1187(+)|eukprot:CAMPEP_0198726186 /NCGR_PEP_ID=MMETSP1475-20131203/3313_1 /TAXON_ID= ORGANISM="Unidentified sp., Strain CCMP1999" /NCGR_SAMPLE_ID=MMETSP1475 /ASSEMBLY_ACC=CAM_ASM_001111 /LENGTH=295 /DNA_ID=CAMNT_0044488089 /DNA_START=283 /DNA_END=1170 /DNA_ORIENTATION=+
MATMPPADESSQPQVPPAAPDLPKFGDANASASATRVPETQIERVIYWRDPIFTGGIFGTVNLLCFLTLFLKYTFLSVFSYCLLVFLIGCFLYVNGSKLLVGHLGENRLPPQPNFGLQKFSSEALHAKVDPAVDTLNEMMEKGRDIVLCKNNVATLKALAIVFLMYQIGKFIPDLVLFYLIFLVVFTVPKFYEMNKEDIDKAAAQAQTRFTEEKDKMLKVANERTLEIREQASKKIQETATPIMEKVQPKIDELRKRVAKGPATTTSPTTSATTTTTPTTSSTTSSTTTASIKKD